MEIQPKATMKFDLFSYCPALMALWDKHITDEHGYILPADKITDLGFKVEINYNPQYPDTAFTECVAPVKEKKAKHPGAPYVRFIETVPTSDGLADRFKVRCGGCILLKGGFSTTTRYYQ